MAGPPRDLRLVVRRFRQWSPSMIGEFAVEALTPRLGASLFLVLTGRARLIPESPLKPIRSEEATLALPAATQPRSLIMEGATTVFSIEFAETGLSAIAQEPDTPGEAISLTARELTTALRATPDFSDRVARASQWIRGQSRRPASPSMAKAARCLRRFPAKGMVAKLAGRAGLSTRHFSRRFRHDTGLSASLYQRIARVRAAVLLHLAEPNLHWAGVAMEAGFSDQAHLNREFWAFLDLRPSDWDTLDYG